MIASPSEPLAAPPVDLPRTKRLVPQTGLIAAANAAVAGLGFSGNVLLARALSKEAFAAVTIFQIAFQFLQDAMGRSLNWAMLRLAPMAEGERAGGSAAMVRATRSIQKLFALAGPLVVLAVGLLLQRWIDAPGGHSRVLMVVLAAVGASGAVMFQLELGVLQLRERFVRFTGWMVGNSCVRLVVWSALWGLGVLDLTTAIAGHLASTVFVMVALMRSQQRRGEAQSAAGTEPPVAAADRARVLHFGGRMVVATALGALAAQVDLFFLDNAAAARLRVASLVASAIEMATSAIMIALLPHAGRASDAAAQRRSMRVGLALGGIVAAGAILSCPAVEYALPLLFTKDYANAVALYPVLLGGVVLTALTDPLGLVFVSRNRPGRFVILNGVTLLVILLGNAVVPGSDRALVAAWVRTAGRAILAAGIIWFIIRDARAGASPTERDEPAPPPKPAMS